MDGLARQLGECADGAGQLALISGGLASGKTRLLHEFSRCARESGALHLTATGSRAEDDFPVGGVDQLFRNPDIPPEVAECAARLLPDATGAAGAAGAVHEITVRLLELARHRPLVVSIDDIQFADEFTLRLIRHLRQRIASARVMIVLTEWSWAHPAMTRFHAEITQHPHLRLRLAPMDEPALRQMIAEQAADHADNPTTAQPEREHEYDASSLLRLTGGNPLLAGALLEDHRAWQLANPGATAEHPVVGSSYAQGVLNCLYRWDTGLLTVAQGLAVLSPERASAPLVAQLVTLPVDAVEQVLNVLSAAGVLDGVRFHPVAAQAVLGTLAPGERARLHATAAELLQLRGTDPVTVAEQLIASATATTAATSAATATTAAPWPAWAADVLRRAAAEAATGDDVELVTRCLELALEVTADPAEQEVLRRGLSRAVWQVDPAASDRWQAAPRSALAQGALAGREALPLLKQALWKGDTATARTAREAYEQRGAGRGGDRYAEAELLLAYRWFYGPGTDGGTSTSPSTLTGTGTGTLTGARAGAGTGGDPHREDPWIRAVHAVAEGSVGANARGALPSAEHILESCRPGDSLLEVVLAALFTLIGGNQLQQAGEQTERLYAEARRRGVLTWQAALGTVRAEIALGRGEPAAAANRARATLDVLSPQGWGVMRGYPLSVLISAQTAMGRHTEAEEPIRQMAPEAMPTTVWGLRFLCARGHHHLATDRLLAAVRDFQTCGRLAQEAHLDLPFVPWRIGLAEAHLRLGRTVVARDLVKQQLDRAQAIGPRTRGISLRLLAACGELMQRPALLRKSVEVLQAAGDRMELARSLADLSVACRNVGELDEARAASWRAAQEAKICQSGYRAAAATDAVTHAPRMSRTSHPGHGTTAHAAEWGEQAPGAGKIGGAGGAGGIGDARELGDARGIRNTRGIENTRGIDDLRNVGDAGDSEASLLSDAENRVALLAARGFSNRDISQQLFITVSTVEQHLTRVYRKLGVSSRRALPTRLLAPPLQAL
ncbi:LuxR C-terminal-related transcriptional regulator [Streptomyces sp. NPDC056255]|uniref:helix-turn-helix transcriptional regulator n=1 Tax=Streptomyces sp. NPDC056255 TaxID=3345764 RepID=UPI0035DB8542